MLIWRSAESPPRLMMELVGDEVWVYIEDTVPPNKARRRNILSVKRDVWLEVADRLREVVYGGD